MSHLSISFLMLLLQISLKKIIKDQNRQTFLRSLLSLICVSDVQIVSEVSYLIKRNSNVCMQY